MAPCFGFIGGEGTWENMIGACGLSGHLVLLVEQHRNGVDGKLIKHQGDVCPRTEKVENTK